jgi:ubiquinone/menaquinone biosynthesis C-methylase UbiE
MDIQQAYNVWADSYDDMANKTRDLEAVALRTMLADLRPVGILELGCGTGKNTQWLMGQAGMLTAVDFSEAMLAKARQQVTAPHVRFVQADLLQPWSFVTGLYGLVTFSLVLEHLEHLPPIFEKVAAVLRPGGFLYVGELHPFKQYTGSKAKFDTGEGIFELTCFVHHLSDFIGAVQQAGLQVAQVQEWFVDNDRSQPPRILSMLFQKPV